MINETWAKLDSLMRIEADDAAAPVSRPISRDELSRDLAGGVPASIGPERRKGARPVDELEREMALIFKTASGVKPEWDLVRAIILLRHDHLDASHSISQNIHNANGSYVHGIMHRREPDYRNAKYWFQRVGSHPFYRDLGQMLAPTAGEREELYDEICPNRIWDPFAFVDACERELGSGSKRERMLEIYQFHEMHDLLHHVLKVDHQTR